jgi:hypothetical protein
MTTKIGGKRPGAGRPRTISGNKSIHMGVVLGDDLKDDIKKAAEELGITQNELLRRAAKFALNHKQQLVIIRSKGDRRGKKDQ